MAARRAAAPRRSAHRPIAGVLFDLDGTLLLSDRSLGGYELLPGAAEVLAELKRRGLPFAVLTNGSAYPPEEQAAKLRAHGLPVDDDRMLTPSSVAAQIMRRDGVQRALIMGSLGVGHALRQSGIDTVQPGDASERQVQAVYVGWYPDCNMRAIEAACHAIWNGARLYVASDVPFFASKQGRTMGYSFAIVAAIRRVTKAPMVLTGKPSQHALRHAARVLGLACNELAVVGDDPAVEVLMARRGGAQAFGVCTGVTNAAKWQAQTGLRRPAGVLVRLDELLDYLPSGAIPRGE